MLKGIEAGFLVIVSFMMYSDLVAKITSIDLDDPLTLRHLSEFLAFVHTIIS